MFAFARCLITTHIVAYRSMPTKALPETAAHPAFNAVLPAAKNNGCRMTAWFVPRRRYRNRPAGEVPSGSVHRVTRGLVHCRNRLDITN
jgi:hypothetical protein